ncbi:Cytidine deaminase [Corynebacterium choanae]|uniref:Cytidine deaminase n=2 Tax=Corynebacterium choanae TaxID=1862358 RepID=A0A3G6J418_9CORY|nr:Cytidine deaminase [Corynebacterium choanae]
MTDHHALLQQAKAAAAHAYAPYSSFPVGAALLLDDGTVVTGCNVENASYGLAICAERCAITRMVASSEHAPGDGHPPRKKIKVAAIVGLQAAPCWPCGACRQFLSEFSCETVVVENPDDADNPLVLPFSELLPHAFGPDAL